tara:strand:+ start:88 stop:315 length:228 start_codon:yes stop_codon:yes gene_type:complete
MRHTRKRLPHGDYLYRQFTITPNFWGDYGLPKSAWVVVDPKGEEITALYRLKDATEYIDQLYDDPLIDTPKEDRS